VAIEKELADEDIILFQTELVENGYDFTGYSKESFKRRLNRLLIMGSFSDFGDFKEKIKQSPGFLQHLIQEITVNVTEMFRDPSFYKVLREVILPQLAEKPLIKIWHAGCSTGEEVYSMAILLREANLLEKSLVYATDLNPEVLEKLHKGIFPLNQLKHYSANYIQSGGQKDFSSYYTAYYNWVKFDESLQRQVVISTHNLVSDSSFNEFDLIICRNVLIYFDKLLQEKVFRLFDQSLERKGFLCLGSRESLQFSQIAPAYKQLPGKEKIWQKKG
jgi:chemotaxis protein methyltransferase CheR